MALIYSSAFNKRLNPISQQQHSVVRAKRSVVGDSPQGAACLSQKPARRSEKGCRESLLLQEPPVGLEGGFAGGDECYHAKHRSNDETSAHRFHNSLFGSSGHPHNNGLSVDQGKSVRGRSSPTGGGLDGEKVRRKLTEPPGGVAKSQRDDSGGKRKVSTPTMSMAAVSAQPTEMPKSGRIASMRKVLARRRLVQLYAGAEKGSNNGEQDEGDGGPDADGDGGRVALAKCVRLHKKFHSDSSPRRRSISLDMAVLTRSYHEELVICSSDDSPSGSRSSSDSKGKSGAFRRMRNRFNKLLSTNSVND